MLTKLKSTEEVNKARLTTKAIRNVGKVLNMYIIAINKISSKLKVWCFKTPHYELPKPFSITNIKLKNNFS